MKATPIMFEDEIIEVLRECPHGSRIIIGDGSHPWNRFSIYHSATYEDGFSYTPEYKAVDGYGNDATGLKFKIYNALECGKTVTLNGVDITEWRKE